VVKSLLSGINAVKIENIKLSGKFITLEPLALHHLDDLCEVGLDESLWRLIPTQITNRDDMRRYVETAIDENSRGVSLPFATILNETNKAIGSTRFGNIRVKDRGVEIGWTWLTPKYQRTFANTEAKLLMLTHAFETWKCIRVELKTDALNSQSRNAILRLGATQEGVFRQHIVCDTGRLRESVYFSILDSDWSLVKKNLIEKLK
jgi:N-acetyltransferase